MLEPPTCCARCGFRITPDDHTARVVDEFGSNVRHKLCSVELLDIAGVTIVIPRPAEVPA